MRGLPENNLYPPRRQERAPVPAAAFGERDQFALTRCYVLRVPPYACAGPPGGGAPLLVPAWSSTT